MKSINIIPTIVPDSLTAVEEVSEKYAHFAPYFQIDVADGKFAPNTTWLPSEGDRLSGEFSYEAHLMVSDPHSVGLSFAKAGAHTIIGHIEALGSIENAARAIETWKAAGARSAGAAVLLQTPLEDVEPYLSLVDFVQFMTIARIGVQGIPFEESSIARVAEFRKRHADTVIAVDGGVSEANIAGLAHAGATRFGVGSAIAKNQNPEVAYNSLKIAAESAIQ